MQPGDIQYLKEIKPEYLFTLEILNEYSSRKEVKVLSHNLSSAKKKVSDLLERGNISGIKFISAVEIIHQKNNESR